MSYLPALPTYDFSPWSDEQSAAVGDYKAASDNLTAAQRDLQRASARVQDAERPLEIARSKYKTLFPRNAAPKQ